MSSLSTDSVLLSLCLYLGLCNMLSSFSKHFQQPLYYSGRSIVGVALNPVLLLPCFYHIGQSPLLWQHPFHVA